MAMRVYGRVIGQTGVHRVLQFEPGGDDGCQLPGVGILHLAEGCQLLMARGDCFF